MENARTGQRISAFNEQHFANLNYPTLSIILRQHKCIIESRILVPVNIRRLIT
jgi:hypothetical protein